MDADRSVGAIATLGNPENFIVCVRIRNGGSSNESADLLTSGKGIWKVDERTNTITATESHPSRAKRGSAGASAEANTSYTFSFDSVAPPARSTSELFDAHIAPIVSAAVDGYNGTVFAYGQTGSGKTYTMSGTEAKPGIIPRAINNIFDTIAESNTREFLVRVSYLELYNEQLKDLLADRPAPASPIKGGRTHTSQSSGGQLRIVEEKGRVAIAGLQEEIVTSTSDVLALLEKGQASRHVGATDWNEHSSRSHCVLQVTIESRHRDAEKAGKEVRLSQLNLIDLAGSERAASQAERRKEGAFINKSLLTLGTVISKLTESNNVDGGTNSSTTTTNHIPYRDSKLTRILQTSLGGNARVAVICTMSPLTQHAAESLSTLSFGKRCKMVVSNAKRGVIMDDKALLKRYREELDDLRRQLESKEGAGVTPNSSSLDLRAEQEGHEKAMQALGAQKAETQREVEEMTAKRSELKSQIDHLTRLILTGQKIQDGTDEDSGVSGSGFLNIIHSPKRKRGRLTESVLPLGASPKVKEMVDVFGSTARLPMDRGVGQSQTGSNGPSPSKSSTFRNSVVEGDLALLRRGLRDARDTHKSTETSQRATIASLEARNAALQAQISAQERELDEAEAAWIKIKSERDEFRDALEQALEQRDAFESAADSERIAKEQAQSELEAEAARYEERLEEEATRFQTRLDEEIRLLQLVGRFREASSSDTDVKELKDEVERLRKAKADADSELERVRRQSETAISDSERARRDAEQAAERYRAEATQLGRLRGDLEEYRARASALELELTQSKRKSSSHHLGDASELQRRRAELDEKERALARREAMLTERERAALSSPRPLPIPGSRSVSPSKTSRPLPSPNQAADVVRTLSDPSSSSSVTLELQRRNADMEEQIKDLKNRLGKAEDELRSKVAVEGLAERRSSPSPTLAERMEKMVELQMQVDEQAAKITTLTQELAEERKKQARPLPSIPMPGSPTRSPSKLQHEVTPNWSRSGSEVGTTSPSPRFPMPLGFNRTRTMTALAQGTVERPIPIRPSSMSPSISVGGGFRLHRAGSMREWKKYEGPNPASDHQAGGTLKIGGAPGDPSALTIEDAVKAEREEIARLNAVIATQRTLMADLEGSVAKWKERLGAQHKIIDELVKHGENDDKLRRKASMLIPPASPLKRPSSLLGGLPPAPASPSSGLGTSSVPLADTSNKHRPLPVVQARELPPNPWMMSPSVASEYSTAVTGSPVWGSTLSREGSVRSTAASLQDAAGSSKQSHQQQQYKRRQTIEADLVMLQGTPLVEGRKSQLLGSPQAGRTPRSRTASKEIQALLNSNGKRSADWYV